MKARVNGSTFHSSRSSAFSFLLFIPRAWICSSHFALQIFPCARLIAKPVFNLQGGKMNWLTSLLQKKPQMITLSPPCWRGDVTLAFFFNFFLFFWPNFALCLPDWLTKWTKWTPLVLPVVPKWNETFFKCLFRPDSADGVSIGNRSVRHAEPSSFCLKVRFATTYY